MHYDDRLATVLRQPPGGETIARIQYRQLLDLLGTLPAEACGPQIDAAFDRMAELSQTIPAGQRARMLGESSMRLRSPRLLALLAEGEPDVASAAIRTAQLKEDEWLDLVPALPVRSRGLLRHRRGLGARVEERLDRLGVADRGLPPAQSEQVETSARIIRLARSAETAPAPAPAPAPQPAPRDEPGTDDGIGALVRRIEAFRKSREQSEATLDSDDAPRLPLILTDEDQERPRLSAFDFSTDADGRICWADQATAPMAVGLRLGQRGKDNPLQADPTLADTMRQRQPLVAVPVSIEGAPAIGGSWQIDAAPQFDRQTGRFTGYTGRARRPAPMSAVQERAAPADDRMRQVLHELRTPVNAIQMSAEVIQQQLYGPTPHEYRALAATIASDTARILAGFEELDRLVKLDAGQLELEPGQSDLAETVSVIVTNLQAHTGPRKSGFALDMQTASLPVGIDRLQLERMVWRLLAALAGAAAPSEYLSLQCREDAGMARLSVMLPASLAALDNDALFHARAADHPQTLSAGMFGLGFTLRLVAAEARAAGGSLQREGRDLRLYLPVLTEPSANLSQA